MISRCCVVLLHLLALLNEASLQESVVGFIGGSAVLPCSEAPPHNLQEITVRWRYDDNLNVYDIIKSKVSVDEQHLAYKDRAEPFPDEFKKGNFSLKLNNLQNNDTGKYFCYASEIQSVDLLVKVKEESNQVEEKNSQTEGRNHGAQSRPEKIVTAVLLLSVFILSCV